ncbi:uncharacterized protein BJX67DRAFT_30007 [Aspergillus lucknowensis]|uniref:Uncharacterized protein n=1 Tax=Aspergillus lucknowensis TaxID=176173 RepID=A0ABR4LWN1_9EURO
MSGSFDTHDLRQAGTAAKRAYNHKAKWRHGGRTANIRFNSPTDPITRPAKPPVYVKLWTRIDRECDTNEKLGQAKIDLRSDVREALESGSSDNSSVEDRGERVGAPIIADDSQVEDGVTHLYEVSGETMFRNVVDKAIERFETKETEKLAKEYEFITRESEISIGYLADEDDFELVDHVQL